MSKLAASLRDRKIGFDMIHLDVSCLVGYEIKIYSKQFPGRELRSKVLSTHGLEITADSGRNCRLIDNLVNQQKVILQFPYKGQDLAVRAQLKRSNGGQCRFVVDKHIVPLSQRKHHRLNLRLAVQLAAYPILTYGHRDLSNLRWIATDSVNVSSGGMMVNLPGFLEREVYILIHINWDESHFPPLVLGGVRHCFQADDGQFMAGIEFIIKEVGQKLFAPDRLRELPPTVLDYTSKQREKLNRKFLLWNPEEKDQNRSSR